MTAGYAILAALFDQQRTGRGQRLGINMISSSIAFLGAEAQIFFESGSPPGPYTRPANSLSFALRCSDGHLLGIHLSSVPKFWEALVQVLGKPELAHDPRFATRAERSANYESLRLALEETVSLRPRASWLKLMIDADVPCAPIYDMGEVFEDEQVRIMGIEQQMTHPERGIMKTVAVPIDFSESDLSSPLPPPGVGEHTRQILDEIGLKSAAVDQLIRDGVVRARVLETELSAK
jgi:formyl-CoA transferase